jgi:CysZ protein
VAAGNRTIYETYDPRARNPLRHFSAGVRFFFAGLRMLAHHPSLVGLSIIPILLTLIALISLVMGSVWVAGRLLGGAFLPFGGQLLIFAQAVILLLAFFFSYLIYLPLARILLAPFSEAISRRTHRIVAGEVRTPEVRGWGRAILEGAKLVAFQAVIALMALVIGLIFPPLAGPLGVAVTVSFVCLDFMDVPLAVRGRKLGEKLRYILNCKMLALGFGAAGYLLLIIPFVNLLALPVGVIGATLLVASREREIAAQPTPKPSRSKD